MNAILMYHASMLGAVLDLVLLLAISRRRVAEGLEVFRLLLAAVVLWTIGDANARLALGPGMRSFWLWVEFVGRPLAPALWLLFTLRYTRVWSRAARRQQTALFAIPVMTLLLAWTNQLHALVWSRDVVHLPGLSAGSLPGPWFRWVHLPYAWVAVALGCFLIVSRGARRGRRPVHPWLFLLIGLPPLVVSVAGVFFEGLRELSGLVPLAFGVGGLPLLYGLARSPAFGLSPFTYRSVFESIGDAVLVVDAEGRIMDLNRAAEGIFRRSRRLVIGQPVEALLPAWQDLERKLGARSETHEEVRLGIGPGERILQVDVFALGNGGSTATELLLVRDVSSRRAHEEQIEHLAYHDPLTGLPNRRWLKDAGDKLLSHAARGGRLAGVLFVDLDDFKDVNDTLGHAAGDELLLEVAQRFRATTRSESVLVRLGGDEFAVLLSDCDAAAARTAADRLLVALQEPFHPADAEVYVGASIGVALFPEHGSDMDSLLRRADVAMYTAKRSRGRVELYDPDTDMYTPARLHLQSELYRALLEPDQLRVYYQPIYDLECEEVVGVEALVRWQHPERGFLEPASFLSVAENARLIPRLDRYVLHRALDDWRHAGIRIAVNVHPRTLADPEYCQRVAEELECAGLPANRLMLEITERALTDPEGMRAALSQLASLGVALMADDYGIGQSSLIYIRRFPFHGLKVDRSLTSGIGARPEDEAVVEAIARLAAKLDLELVVEGVETRDAMDWLRERGCPLIQGFAIGRPQPLDEVLARYPELSRPRLVAVSGCG